MNMDEHFHLHYNSYAGDLEPYDSHFHNSPTTQEIDCDFSRSPSLTPNYSFGTSPPQSKSKTVAEDDILGHFLSVDPLSSFQKVPNNEAEISKDWLNSVDPDKVLTLLSINESLTEVLNNFVQRVSAAIIKVREKQKSIKKKLNILANNTSLFKRKKVPLLRFSAPYFRDSHGMVPSKNEEHKERIIVREYDPLIPESKKWTAEELQMLQDAVKESIIEMRILPFVCRKELYCEKIANSGQETTSFQKHDWKKKVEELDRLITYHSNIDENELFESDYSEVDWVKVANLHFKGIRSSSEVRLKWMNEQCPKWSKNAWTVDELRSLQKLAKESWINWDIIAEKINSSRNPFLCFVKYKSELAVEDGKLWTNDEDMNLGLAVLCFSNGRVISWRQVASLMKDRNQQQCRLRFLRSVSSELKRGRWSVEEDVLLTCAVSVNGVKNWSKVATHLGRSDAQCRERWVNVLNRSMKDDPWTIEEDKQLVNCFNKYGREWSIICNFIPGRSPKQCKTRLNSLIYMNTINFVAKGSVTRTNLNFDRIRERRRLVENQFAELLCADGNNEEGSLILHCLIEEALKIKSEEESMTLLFKDVEGNTDEQAPSAIARKQLCDLLVQKLQSIAESKEGTVGELVSNMVKRGSDCMLRCKPLLTVEEEGEFERRLKELRNEEEKKMFLIDSIINLIDRSDSEKEWMEQKNVAKNVTNSELTQVFMNELISNVNDHILAANPIEPSWPSSATVDMYEHLKRKMPSMAVTASTILPPLRKDLNGKYRRMGLIPTILSDELKNEGEYGLLKVKMRKMFYWPALMDSAILDEGLLEARRTFADIVREMEIEDLRMGPYRPVAPATQIDTIDECIEEVRRKVEAIHRRDFIQKKMKRNPVKKNAKNGKTTEDIELVQSSTDVPSTSCNQSVTQVTQQPVDQSYSNEDEISCFIVPILETTYQVNDIADCNSRDCNNFDKSSEIIDVTSNFASDISSEANSKREGRTRKSKIRGSTQEDLPTCSYNAEAEASEETCSKRPKLDEGEPNMTASKKEKINSVISKKTKRVSKTAKKLSGNEPVIDDFSASNEFYNFTQTPVKGKSRYGREIRSPKRII